MYAELGIGVAIVAVVCYYAHMLYNSLAAVRKRWEYLDKVPGMPPHPLWGNVHTVRSRPNISVSMYFTLAVAVY
jgi:hypothetical protein